MSDADTEKAESRGLRLLRAPLTRLPVWFGAFLGVVFWFFSLFPTLMPRTVVTQGASSGLCAAIGVGLGTLVGSIIRRILYRLDKAPRPQTRRNLWRGLAVLAVVLVVTGPIIWIATQGTQRKAMAMEPLGVVSVIPMLLISVVVAWLFIVIGRGVGSLVGMLRRLVARVVPEAGATLATTALVIVVVGFVVWPGLSGRFASWANSSFGLTDTTTTPGTRQPTAATVSAGEGSLVKWDHLGRHGRDFVAGATSAAELKRDNPGGPVTDPVRVYVGLDSASGAKARAELAVRELERTGGFDRKVLVVVTSTGSGWVDPDAATAIEALWRGDTAIVSQQYSFLPSWIATLLEPDEAGEAASALFEAVHAHWTELPEATRPKLVVFGLSLGSKGAEQAFAAPTAQGSLANLTERTDGVLLVGATGSNPIWRQLTDGRDASSPVWRPVVDDGEVARFENRDPVLGGIDRTWPAPRVLYVQHPSDPVTFWDASWLWQRPEWMNAPRGAAVTAHTWFPVVTGVQGVFDLMAGFGAPPGFGHDYRLDYVRAWAQVAPPDGWTDSDTKALETKLHPGGN